jgi:hypothetical protein
MTWPMQQVLIKDPVTDQSSIIYIYIYTRRLYSEHTLRYSGDCADPSGAEGWTALLFGRAPSKSRCHQAARDGPLGWNRRDMGRSITDSFNRMQQSVIRGHKILALTQVTTHVVQRRQGRPVISGTTNEVQQGGLKEQ